MQLAFGWRTPEAMHADTPALDMAAMLLGTGRASRLYRALRDHKLVTSISASNHTPGDVGVFTIHAEVSPELARDAARAIWSEVLALREQPASEMELLRARRILQSQWLRRLESMDGQAMWLSSWEALGGWQLGQQYYARMMSLTGAEVMQAARKYLELDQLSVGAYRPRGAPAIAASASDMRAVLAESMIPLQRIDAEHVRETPLVWPQRPKMELVSGRVQLFRGENGVPILVRRTSGSPLVHATLQSLGGVHMEDQTRAGLTLLMARTAIKGTMRRTTSEIADELEIHGGSLAAGAGLESFGWTLAAPLEHLDAVLDIFADVTQEPSFHEDSLEAERAVLAGEIRLLRDDMYRFPIRLAMQTAYGAHPYGRSVQGDEETIRAVQADDLAAWHARNVMNGPVALAIVGDMPEELLAEKVATAFQRLRYSENRGASVPVWPAEQVMQVERRDKAQTAIAVAMSGVSRTSPSRFAAELVATIGSGLGGRFFDELRDRQSLAYTVQAFPVERRAGGAFLGYIATSPEKEEIALEGLTAEMEKLGREPVSDEELVRAKEYTIGSRAIRMQSGAAVLSEIVDAYLYGTGLEEIEEADSRVRSVTAEEIMAFAGEHFRADRRAVGIVRGEVKD
jgi:zinc protease